MSVTVSEVLVAARSGVAAISSETAGYLVLGTADCLGDAAVGIASVYLDEDGALRVDRRTASVLGDSEAGLRTVLKRLLETGRSPAPALLRVASAGEKRGIRRLVTEIEAALIPVNRAAARRALARLHRDVLRGKAAGKLASAADEMLLLEPSVAPPRAVPVAPIAEAPSTEGPTPVVPDIEPIPVVPDIEPIPIVAGVEPPWLAPVEALEASPAVWAEYAPDATPVLGSVVTAPLDVPAPDPWAELEIGAPDTDRAPPVELDAPSHTPRFAAETAIIGTYGASPFPASASLEIPVDLELPEHITDEVIDRAPGARADDEPVEIFDEAVEPADGIAIVGFEVNAEPGLSEPQPELSEPELSEPELSEPELSEPEPELSEPELSEPEVFEPVFAQETDIAIGASGLAGGREARDALEAALFDFGQSEVPPLVESGEPSRERFVPMFDLSPAPGDVATEIDVPLRTDQAPALGAADSMFVVEEPGASVEELIDEALAMIPETEGEGSLSLPLSSPAILPRVSAIRYESGTAPGLGFVNIALVAANVQGEVPPVVATFDDVETEAELEPPVSGLPPVEPALEELPSIEPPEAELPSIEPPEAELPSIEPPEAELPSIEPPEAELPSIEPPEAELPPIEPPEAELPPIEPPEAELQSAQPSVVEFTSIEPAIAEFEAISAESDFDVFEPMVAELAVAELAVAELAVAEPAVVEAMLDEPAAVEQAVVAEPVVAEPVVAEPVVAEPAVAEPAVAEPVVAEPVVAEPAVAEPAVAEPAVTEPAVTESADLEPSIGESDPAFDESERVFDEDESAFDESERVFDEDESAFDESERVFDEDESALDESERIFNEYEEYEPAFEAAPVELPAVEAVVARPEDEPIAEVPAVTAPSYRPKRSDVADLVAAFVVAESRSLSELSRELKRIAGIGATPAPPEVASAPVRRKVSSAR